MLGPDSLDESSATFTVWIAPHDGGLFAAVDLLASGVWTFVDGREERRGGVVTGGVVRFTHAANARFNLFLSGPLLVGSTVT